MIESFTTSNKDKSREKTIDVVAPPTTTKNKEGAERRRRRRRELHSPGMYQLVSGVIFALTFGGFLPAVWAFLREGYWWLNPLVRSPEWKNPHSGALKWHVIFSLAWLAVVVFQCSVSVGYMFGGANLEGRNARRTARVRRLHGIVGYAGFALCALLVINAHVVSYRRGVPGKLHMNGIATIVGAGMMYHLTLAVRDIRAKNVEGHMWHVAGAVVWIAFPGIGRTLGLLIQALVLNATGCDFLYASGWLTPVVLLQVALLHAYRYSMLGSRFKPKDYAVFFLLMAVDLLLAKADDSLLRCPEQPMMAQIPGRPWVLQNSTNSLYAGEAPWMRTATNASGGTHEL